MNLQEHLTEFTYDNLKQEVIFIESNTVTEGVQCDVYQFKDDETKDLGIIKMKSGTKTPLQKILKGENVLLKDTFKAKVD